MVKLQGAKLKDPRKSVSIFFPDTWSKKIRAKFGIDLFKILNLNDFRYFS